MNKIKHYLVGVLVPIMILCGCSVNKYIPEGEYLLDGVKVESDNKEIKSSEIQTYLRQTPNAKWFSLAPIPMYIYSASGRDSARWFNRFLKRLGDEPEIYSRTLADESRVQMERAVHNKGYMGATVELKETAKKNRMKLEYKLKTGKPYMVNNIAYDIYDSSLRDLILNDTLHTLLHAGMRLDVNVLEQERQRITTELQNVGYFRFNKDFISFVADTMRNTYKVDLTLKVMPLCVKADGTYERHHVYRINAVNYILDTEQVNLSDEVLHSMDTLTAGNIKVYHQNKPFLRPSVINTNNYLTVGNVYSLKDVQRTYASLARLNILKFTNIRFRETPVMYGDTATVDVDVTLSQNANKGIAFEVEGTNSAGDLGAAASIELTHKNIFHGSEKLSLKVRGAYENVKGLEGYVNTDYIELGVDAGLTLPEFKFPFLKSEFKKNIRANSEFSMKYNWQIRPEFERTLAAATWGYSWSGRKKGWHRLDLLDLNYIYMPYRSSEFEDYLNEMDEVNPLLRYSYEDIFIVKLGYSFNFNSIGASPMQTSHRSSYSFRINIEEAGNLMYGVSKIFKRKPDDGESYKLANIDFAQYIKVDLDYARNYVIDERNAIVFHAGLGVAYPYGNSKSLPFEKLYFSGGANSVRGWSVRSLGPGGYRGEENHIDYVNHTGDMKIDFNLEYRTHLFWKLKGAVYVDAGNVWNIRERSGQPEGTFRFGSFFKQMAVSYGLGVRLDLDFLVLRFDTGMKAVNPVYKGREHFPIICPDFNRDFAFHFAVGYPF